VSDSLKNQIDGYGSFYSVIYKQIKEWTRKWQELTWYGTLQLQQSTYITLHVFASRGSGGGRESQLLVHYQLILYHLLICRWLTYVHYLRWF